MTAERGDIEALRAAYDKWTVSTLEILDTDPAVPLNVGQFADYAAAMSGFVRANLEVMAELADGHSRLLDERNDREQT